MLTPCSSMTRRSAEGRERRRGGALVLSLAAVGAIAILAVGYLQLSSTLARRQTGAVDNNLAFYTAEAGLTEAYAGIMIGKTGNIGSPEQPAVYGDGLFWVEANPVDQERVELRATGMANSGRATLALVLRKGSVDVSSLGFFSAGDITVGDGTRIDGWDSDLGSYTDQADGTANVLGRLGSNGTITLIDGASNLVTTVLGDVAPGPAGSVVVVGNPTVAGTSAPSLTATTLPLLNVPTPTLLPAISHAAGVPLVLPGGSWGLTHLGLLQDAEVTIQGPAQVVIQGIDVADGASLTLDTQGGPIQLYVTGDIDIAAGASVTTTEQVPSRLRLYVDGEASVDLRGPSQFYGLIYAPEGTISLESEFEVFGGLVAGELSLEDGARLHYDVALAKNALDDAKPVVESWRIVELPTDIPKGFDGDPFVTLGLDPSLLQAPAASHADQTIQVTYVDSGGATQSYDGLESTFDWSNVATVLSLVRQGGLMDTDVGDVFGGQKVAPLGLGG